MHSTVGRTSSTPASCRFLVRVFMPHHLVAELLLRGAALLLAAVSGKRRSRSRGRHLCPPAAPGDRFFRYRSWASPAERSRSADTCTARVCVLRGPAAPASPFWG